MMRRDGREVWTSRIAGGLVGLALVGACAMGLMSVRPAYAAGGDVVFYSGGGSVNLQSAPQEVVIELDGTRPFAQVNADLAAAGFPTTMSITGLSARFAYRKVALNAVTDEAIGQLRAVPGIKEVRPVYRPAGSPTTVVIPTGQLSVRFSPGTPSATALSVVQQAGARVVRALDGLPGGYVLEPINERERDAFAIAATLNADGRTRFSHPSYLMLGLLKYHQVGIQDPLFPFQWHLNNTGQLEEALPDADIDAVEAWEVTRGQGAIIGVNDSSIQRDHEDLVANYLTGFDFADQDGDPSPATPASSEAHGCSVAGLIAAAANNVGVRGVAPESQIIGARYSAFFSLTDLDIAESFLFHERNGAQAINNSWGLGGVVLPTIPTSLILLPDVISEAIVEVSTNGRSGRGVLVLFSSGNGSTQIAYDNIYSGIPQVMSIGATLRDDLLTCYSSYGAEQSVVAPGGGFAIPRSLGGGLGFADECYNADMATVDIDESLATIAPTQPGELPTPIYGWNPPTRIVGGLEVIDPEIPDFPDTKYTYQFNGTSSACPVTAGVAALVFSVNTNYTAEQVRNLIEHTAEKITVPNEEFDQVTGHNPRYGHGRVNANLAVQAAVRAETWPSPVTDITVSSSRTYSELRWLNPANDVASVLIVRSLNAELNWAPTDGIEYTVGQQVAPGVVVVLNSPDERLVQESLTEGAYEYGFFVRNGQNFYSWGRRTSLQAEGALPLPKASIVASVRAGRAPLTIHFAGGSIDPSGTKNLSFQWEFGDGNTAVGPAVDHTYSSPGEFFPQLRVTNPSGITAVATTRIAVSQGRTLPPQATIVANPLVGQVPLAVVFEAVATDVDGVIIKYEWDFGNGFSAVGDVVEHVYLAAGEYIATLTVTDDQGARGKASVLITVGAASTTAAETDPPGLLDGMGNCGAGLPVAAVGSLLGLCGLMAVNRRRRV